MEGSVSAMVLLGKGLIEGMVREEVWERRKCLIVFQDSCCVG